MIVFHNGVEVPETEIYSFAFEEWLVQIVSNKNRQYAESVSLFLGRALTKTQRSISNICYSLNKTRSCPSCPERNEHSCLLLLLHTSSLFDVNASAVFSQSLFHVERIELFFAPSFCRSSHFTSLLLSGKNSLIALGFASDRLFCLCLQLFCLINSCWSGASLLWEGLTKEIADVP